MEKFETHHTPGPWAIARETPNMFKINHSKNCNECEQIEVWKGKWTGVSDEEAAANAHLIAAAPLLLSALIKAVEYHDGYVAYQEERTGVKEGYRPEWYNEAKAALTAAGVTVKTVEDDHA